MKKILSNLFLLLVWACVTLPITSACYSEYNPNDNIETTNNKYAYVPDNIHTVTIDSCQYIIFVVDVGLASHIRGTASTARRENENTPGSSSSS